jgi:hypothetical protein
MTKLFLAAMSLVLIGFWGSVGALMYSMMM